MDNGSLSNWFFVDVAIDGGSVSNFVESVRIEEDKKRFSEAIITIANPNLKLSKDQVADLMFEYNIPVDIRFGYKDGDQRAMKLTTLKTKYSFTAKGVPTIVVTAQVRGTQVTFTRKERKEVHKQKSVKDIINHAAGRSGFIPNYSRADMAKLTIKMDEIPNDGETDLDFIARLANTTYHSLHMSAKDNKTLYIVRERGTSGVEHTFGFYEGIVGSDSPIVSFECSTDTLIGSRLKGQHFDRKKGTIKPGQLDLGKVPINSYGDIYASLGDEANQYMNWHEPDPHRIQDLKNYQNQLKGKDLISGEVELAGFPLVQLFDLCNIVGTEVGFVQEMAWEVVGIKHDIDGKKGFLTSCNVVRPAFDGRGKGASKPTKQKAQDALAAGKDINELPFEQQRAIRGFDLLPRDLNPVVPLASRDIANKMNQEDDAAKKK